LLGRAQLDLSHTDLAIQELEAASKIAPTSPEIHFNLAKAYAKVNQPEKADAERAIFVRLNALSEQQRGLNGNQNYTVPRDAAGLINSVKRLAARVHCGEAELDVTRELARRAFANFLGNFFDLLCLLDDGYRQRRIQIRGFELLLQFRRHLKKFVDIRFDDFLIFLGDCPRLVVPLPDARVVETCGASWFLGALGEGIGCGVGMLCCG
jgi:hypothetical protein